jgi:predicted GNAT superfamily acetyltransferase
LEIQRLVWKHEEADLTPIHQFRITSRMGAILLGGYIGGRLVGFVYSFPAIHEGRLVQHSHLLAVLPEYQGWGVGKALKWAQRDRAIELGHDLITWTFDPLQARNANLNLHALGAITRTYWKNFYGSQRALILGPGVQTDRFLVEWRVGEERLDERRRGNITKLEPGGMPRALEAKSDGRFSPPARPRLSLAERAILAEVPRAVADLRTRPGIIAAWQGALRLVFHRYLAAGYAVDDFIFGDRCFYVLSRLPAAEHSGAGTDSR